LIEPSGLRPNHSMPPRRGEQMAGTRFLGLPASTAGLGAGPQRVPDAAPPGDDHEALPGFDFHDVTHN